MGDRRHVTRDEARGRIHGRTIRRLAALAAALLVLAGAGCGWMRVLRPKTEPPAAVVRDVEQIRAALQAVDGASAHLLLSAIGRTNTPGLDLPVWRMVYRPFRPGLKTVLLLAGVHGNETAGVACALGVVDRLAPASPATAAYDLDVVPLLNPWGYVHDLATAPGGVDISTDFASFDSHEARILRRFLREKRYDLVIDLREDAAAEGFSIWQYGLPDTEAARRVVEGVRQAGYPIADSATVAFLRPRDGVVTAPMWGLTILRLTRRLTLAGYVRGEGVSNTVFTVVTPAGLPLVDRTAMHRIAVETLIDAYGAPEKGGAAENAP
ncbi:MAG: succinylglutamate desuccinylase/aspartoacylase family protein [Desulfobacterales bacterium]|jgi:hypothetical protein|nr:succinylglutamate desuccinylase/aspartoacylase family protein [Desulfobacterales bacterium]